MLYYIKLVYTTGDKCFAFKNTKKEKRISAIISYELLLYPYLFTWVIYIDVIFLFINWHWFVVSL